MRYPTILTAAAVALAGLSMPAGAKEKTRY